MIRLFSRLRITSYSVPLVFLILALAFPSNAAEQIFASTDISEYDDLKSLEGGSAVSYEPDFALFDRSIVGRAAPAGIQSTLQNNVYEKLNLMPGGAICYMVDKGMLKRNKRRYSRDDDASDTPSGASDDASPEGSSGFIDSAKLYITATTCQRPDFAKQDGSPIDAPQLTMIISTSDSNPCPKSTDGIQPGDVVDFEYGAAVYATNDTPGEVYVSILAPKEASDVKYSQPYAFEVAASTDTFFHQTNMTKIPELLWLDSDSTSALLVTQNLTDNKTLTDQIVDDGPPFQLFVGNDHGMSLKGMERSVCGMQVYAQISANRNNTGKQDQLVTTGMTTRGPGGYPKQQFLFQKLNSSSNYTGVLVRTSNSTKLNARDDDGTLNGVPGGGGTVYPALSFQTLPETNCRVVTDLDFCDEIQYAVPGNDKKYPNTTQLAKQYDNYAKQMYANFEKVMMQIPCETNDHSKYSLARSCDDCARAYKRWLCTVSIPRCTDANNPVGDFPIRNVNQSYSNGTKLTSEWMDKHGVQSFNLKSRNTFIDEVIQPGPYREILPCDDICYDAVQSCPAAIGFNCPSRGSISYEGSYAQRAKEGQGGLLCNFPGEAKNFVSSAHLQSPRAAFGGFLVFATMVVLATAII